MPSAVFVPSTERDEHLLAESYDNTALVSTIRDTIAAMGHITPTRVRVHVGKTQFRRFDSTGPNFVLEIKSLPNRELEDNGDNLCRLIATALIDLGMTKGRRVHVLLNLKPDLICEIKDDKIRMIR